MKRELDMWIKRLKFTLSETMWLESYRFLIGRVKEKRKNARNGVIHVVTEASVDPTFGVLSESDVEEKVGD